MKTTSPQRSAGGKRREKLALSVPEDGQAEHTIRYLPPDGSTNHCRVFLLTDDGWERLDAEAFGSYLTFTVPGASAQLALVRTIQSWWIAAAAVLAAAVLLLVIFVVLARVAPDFIDSILYTQEELDIIRQI